MIMIADTALLHLKTVISTLDDLQNRDGKSPNNNTKNCLVQILHLILHFLFRYCSEIEIRVLEKSLDYAPIQNKISKQELIDDFNKFCRKMRLRQYFRNDVTRNYCELHAFRPESSWNPPKGHPNFEVFLSETDKKLFSIISTKLGYSNLPTEEWHVIRSLANNRNIVIRKAGKGLASLFGVALITLKKL